MKSRIDIDDRKLEKLEADAAVFRAERHQTRVAALIAEGKLLASRKEWALTATPEALDAFLAGSGGELIASKWPGAVESVTGKGVITAQDRAIAKHTGLTEAQLQDAADIRLKKFGG
jgi:hypothetical protein